MSDKRDTAIGLGLGTAGGFSVRSGLRDLLSNRVLLSYGAGADMGGGHKAPAKAIAGILNDIREEDALKARKSILRRMNPLSAHKMDLIHLPTADYSGNPGGNMADWRRARSGPAVMSVDTGWGAFDPERRFDRTMSRDYVDLYGPDAVRTRKGRRMAKSEQRRARRLYKQMEPGLRDGYGSINVQQDRRLQRAAPGRHLQFQPDGRSDATGYRVSGEASRSLRNKSDVATYGVYDTHVTNLRGKGRLHHMGDVHPAISLNAIPSPLPRSAPNAAGSSVSDQYRQLVSQYTGVSPEQLAKKKILTVSGASRGDSVGARINWVNRQLLRHGQNPDDFFILGIGSGGQERETAIANAGATIRDRSGKVRRLKNFAVTARPGGPKGNMADFITLANNSDMHLMGLGGSTPPEMMLHGGAPIVYMGDEQLFSTRGRHAHSKEVLRRNRGIEAYDQAALKRMTPAERLRHGQNKPRGWMNTLYGPDVATGKRKKLRTGLDGIRSMMNRMGIKELSTNRGREFVDLVTDTPAGLDYRKPERIQHIAERVRDGAERSQAQLKGTTRQLLRKNTARLRGRGAAKAVLGGAALAEGGRRLHRVATKPQTAFQRAMNKKGSDERRPGVLLPGSLMVAGAGTAHTGREVARAARDGERYVQMAEQYARKFNTPLSASNVNPQQIDQFLRVMDEYADAAKKMQSRRIFGIPAHKITGRFPLTGLMDRNLRKTTILEGLGLGHFIAPERRSLRDQVRNPGEHPNAWKRWALMDQQSHYRSMAKNPRQTLANEMLTGSAHKGALPTASTQRVFTPAEERRILNSPEHVRLRDRFPSAQAMRKKRRLANWEDVIRPFQERENRMLRGMSMDDAYRFTDELASAGPAQKKKLMEKARRLRQTAGIQGYGRNVAKANKVIGSRLRRGGSAATALGATWLGTNLIRRNSPKSVFETARRR